MSTPRKPLYSRLPEIYRIRDGEQRPPGQLQAYVDLIDEVFSGVRDSIEALYHDLFIETCDDWVIPYIADLLGTSHLSGDPWTLRADVARTVHHRRRKGTLGAIESLTHALSGWAAQAVELRERLLWNQHLNHQRPDAGGEPPLALRTSLSDAVRGGLVTLRDPALLSFLDAAFDPFAHVVDMKPIRVGAPRYNLPNLAIFLWRLEDYLVPVTPPGFGDKQSLVPASPGDAAWAVRFIVHPMAEPMVLFNTYRFRADDDPPDLSHVDQVPGPMPTPRLTEDAPAGRPEHYVAAVTYAGTVPEAPSADAVGLTLHLPEGPFAGIVWRFRGANLCAWEDGLFPPLRENEIVIDPVHGRVLFGVADEAGEADPLLADLRLSATYGFSGPTGAHPVPRPATPSLWLEETPTVRTVTFGSSADPLGDALADLDALTAPLIVEIEDSMTYALDLNTVSGIGSEGGAPTLRLAGSVWIRAASGQRPVIVLDQPLRFRGDDLTGPAHQVRLEGLYLTWNRGAAAFAASTVGLIEQAALDRLSITGCTLDPGGSIELDGTPQGTRQPIRTALRLGEDYGFANGADTDAFDQIPRLELERSLCGPLAVDADYSLALVGSVVDAGSGVDDALPALAVGAATGNPELRWGPALTVDGMTAFGRMRVESVTGQGGIWIHRLEAHDNQKGCVKLSYFAGQGDRLPPHHGCVFGTAAALSFVGETFGEAGYAQLRLRSDRRVLEQGPGRDAMGAFGYLRNTHKWKNINIRYREFMPVGVRPVLVPVT